jgi:hypothetical protein
MLYSFKVNWARKTSQKSSSNCNKHHTQRDVYMTIAKCQQNEEERKAASAYTSIEHGKSLNKDTCGP